MQEEGDIMAKKKPTYQINGQTERLSRDVHKAIEMGVSYGKYMALKKEFKLA